ncbi:MAG: glycosyltransferase [Candidatus Promineifilaceae bacterium]
MKVTILTAGSRGDVQPYVALGVGLQAAGHRVRLASHDSFRDLVQGHGLAFAPVCRPAPALTASRGWQRWQRSGDNFASYLYHFFRLARQSRATLALMMDDFWAACQGAEVVISSTSGLGGPQMATALGAGHYWALFQPMSRTRAFPHFMTPAGASLGAGFNALTYKLAEQAYWLLFRPALNDWLARTLERPAGGRPQHLEAFLSPGPAPALAGFSRHVIPPPADWAGRVYVCGFWQLEPPAGWQPPAELAAFLAAGPPPIYFYLSGIKVSPPERLLEMALAALRRTGQRGLLFAGARGLDLGGLPGSVMAVGAVPHDWLFPQVAAVVHHGGAGTTASALWAGRPSVGIPGFWDQPFWCRRIHALGVGARPIPLRRLSADSLARAIHEVATDPAMAERAQALGRRIRGENGVQNAVGYLERPERASQGQAGRPLGKSSACG